MISIQPIRTPNIHDLQYILSVAMYGKQTHWKEYLIDNNAKYRCSNIKGPPRNLVLTCPNSVSCPGDFGIASLQNYNV